MFLVLENALPSTQPLKNRSPNPPPKMAPPPILRTQDELLEEIFFLLTTVSDLASASAACVPFRGLITDHGFLRRYRALHPPPLIGVLDLDNGTLAPAQPPHPSAVAARAFAGFDFSCKSFLPTKSGRAWLQLDFLDGRALLTSVLESDLEAMVFNRRQLLFSDIAVCDPVHRRYVLLPAVPCELTALVPKHDLLGLEAFLPPGDDEEDPLSFRVMCLAKRRSPAKKCDSGYMNYMLVSHHHCVHQLYELESVFSMLSGGRRGDLNLYRCVSLVGYCMLPMVIFSAVSLFLPRGGGLIFGMGMGFVMWSIRVYTRLLAELASSGDEHRGLIAYACSLVYMLFSLLVIF
ncbi:uncharacterized protein LOC123409263 [Hordeum vulgare subsp. vulgare]|uniref:uncharacterized protein LOC123409263 n=1 Tax=Hordeum vulgare subsp. vulgare TaxID=112509 RepID=UPI001D1A338A|nr:uncharacterized protein LOC123409263 [Hordeum vulgare subsp. vulgare]